MKKLVKRGFYIYTLVAALLLCGVGWWTRQAVRQKMQRVLEQDLRTILMADVTALDVWMESRLQTASFVASDSRLRAWVGELRTLAQQPDATRESLASSEVQAQLRKHLAEVEQRIGFRGFNVINRDGLILAARQPFLIGRKLRGPRVSNLSQLFKTGEPQLLVPLRNEFGSPFSREPAGFRPNSEPGGAPHQDPDRLPPTEIESAPHLTVMLSSPIKNDHGEVIAAIGFYIRTEDEFTRMLSAARFGESGETYAFNREGILISRSRFDHQLKSLGLLTKEVGVNSVLTLELLDPGGDLTRGYTPSLPRAQWPRTESTTSALAGNTGFNVDGYRDYRGVAVAGAWTWLPRYQIGIATKVDMSEAYQPLQALRSIFLVLICLLALCTGGFLFYSFLATKLRHEIQEAELAMLELGQYRLEEKIGEGGMGVVYRARHALLRRPTAIKLLLPQKASKTTIGQFEKEVRLTSRLTNPNTIQIYDFGHTTDGIFYYAMEYLEGVNLRTLVTRTGPLPSGRVIHLLLQICGALDEAHGIGLVHRDIKPSNVFLTNRGGHADWVKVLDFGLVARSAGADAGEKEGFDDAWIAGTPGYIAPESIRPNTPIDARTDIYSVGALGYFLLSGHGPFEGMTTTAIRKSYLKLDPATQFDFTAWADGPLQRIIKQCLEPDPEKRPQNMRALAEKLTNCPEAGSWTTAMAESWWSQFTAGENLAPEKTRQMDIAAIDRTIKIEFGQRLPRSLS
jgi:eukaryotic-like serine/threonine-protein kinase